MSDLVITGFPKQLPDAGKFHIDRDVLVLMTWGEIGFAQAKLEQLVLENPEFEFSIEDDLCNGGKIISWRKRDANSTRPEAEINHESVRS